MPTILADDIMPETGRMTARLRSATEGEAFRRLRSQRATRAAAVHSLIVSAKMNDTAPQAWLAVVLARIAEHPASRLDEPLPWNWRPARLVFGARE